MFDGIARSQTGREHTVSYLGFPNEVNLEGKVLAVDTVLTRGVEVELTQIVGLATILHGAVCANLQESREILEFTSLGVLVRAEGDGRAFNLLGV